MAIVRQTQKQTPGLPGVFVRARILNVRYWHKADIPSAPHMSAFEGQADIATVASATLP